jgi:hypothetical protein
MSDASGASAIIAKIGRMSVRPEDAADAWERIFGFPDAHLTSQPEATP